VKRLSDNIIDSCHPGIQAARQMQSERHTGSGYKRVEKRNQRSLDIN